MEATLDASTSTAALLSISHAGQTYTVAIPSTSSATLGQLRERLQELTSVPASKQKLICKGKTLSHESDASSLAELGLADGARLLLVGSKAQQLDAFVSESKELSRRYELTGQRQAVKPRKTATAGKTVMDLNDLRRSGIDAFRSIEVLQNCPHEEQRKKRLVKLSKDEAVLECMRQREWTVGLLTELHPHRDPTLLGLNRNAGEAIFLRLLTDDLSGLRSYASTRMVLLHELTHNKHGDHDEAFKSLNSLLNKEVKRFEDEKKAGAHRLGGDIHGAYEVDEAELEQMCGSAGSGAGQVSKGTAAKKKVVREEDGPWEMEQRRQAMLRAAEERARRSTSGSS